MANTKCAASGYFDNSPSVGILNNFLKNSIGIFLERVVLLKLYLGIATGKGVSPIMSIISICDMARQMDDDPFQIPLRLAGWLLRCTTDATVR